MIVTPDFVFVHVRKTGGQFIRTLTKEHSEILYETRLHEPADKLPTEFAHLPVFAAVRNPWDWYVSWYTFMCGLDPSVTGRLFADLTENRSLDFRETVLRACGKTEPIRRRLGGLDLYSWYWWEVIGRALSAGLEADVGRYERLPQEFVAFLDRHRIPGPELRTAILSSPRINASDHDHYRTFYDPVLRDTVGHHTREIAEEYGYRF